MARGTEPAIGPDGPMPLFGIRSRDFAYHGGRIHRSCFRTVGRFGLIIRCGCEFEILSSSANPIFLTLKLRQRPGQYVISERTHFDHANLVREYEDSHGNIIHGHELAPGPHRISYDSLVRVSTLPENHSGVGPQLPVASLPLEVLRYAMPSRYCDSDKLYDFANVRFLSLPAGPRRVQAIFDWVHQNIEYRAGSGSPTISVSEVIAQGFGVCRDFAHVAVALCRCLNIPARYVTGYVPDVGVYDPGTPMDFHAYAEVWLGDRWHIFDARFNEPRVGRVHIAHGLDAVDGAFATVFGATEWRKFVVWSYQVDEAHASLERPVDLSDRLCGTPFIRPSILQPTNSFGLLTEVALPAA